MALSDSVDAVGAVLRRRPSDLLPLYILGAAVPAIVRVVPFLAAILGYYYLAATGRLEAAEAELAGVDTTLPDPEAEPEAVEEWAEQFVPVIDQLLTPTIALLFVGTLFVSFVLGLVLFAVVSAGQLSACYGRLRNERGLIAGIDGTRRYWGRFLGLYILEFLLWMVVIGGGIFLGTIVVGGLALAGPIVGMLGGLLLGLLILFALVVVRALFAFAPVAVVADDQGILGSVSSAAGFIRSEPVGAVLYYVLAIGTIFGLSTVAGVLAYVEAAEIVPLLAALVLLPALDLLKTALYVQYRGRLTPPESPERSLGTQLRDGLRHGWNEMVAFVRVTPGTHAFVIVLAVASFWIGWRVADPYVGTVETSIAARLEGHMPPAAALHFFGNNWMVALTTAFSGVALVIPAITSIVFNGVFMGALSRLEVEPVELVAFVIPHGIFEIPAIFIASALGIVLGVSWWRTLWGQTTRAAFAERLEQAFWVLIGVGILLAVAAVIEGFVSPYYYELFL